jgi:hypothetical protein
MTRTAKNGSGKWLALLCVGALWTAGCFTKEPPKASIAQLVNFRAPIVPPRTSSELADPPDIPMETAEAPPELATVRSAPAKPRVAPAPAAEPEKPEKKSEPAIAPEITSQEAQAAQEETQRNLDAMEKNLTQVTGKQLNASQQDLVSKVHGFAENAREAMKTGDWMRAKNLSKKAVVLSEELAASL